MKAIDNIVVKGNISLTDYLYLSVGANDGTRLYGINPSAHANTKGLTVMHMGDDLSDYSAGGQAFVFRFGNFTTTSITGDIGSSTNNYIDALSLKSTATSTLTTIYNALNFDFAKVASGFVRTDASGNISSAILSASDIPSITVSKLSDFSTSVISLINANNSATTTKLATARTISATGDASWSVSFDGSANATEKLTLANTGITAGSYATTGSYVPTITVDAKGRVTGISNTAVIGDWNTLVNKPGTYSPSAHTHTSLVQTGLAPTSASAPSVWAIPGLDVRRSKDTGSYPYAYGNILSLAGDGVAQIQIGMNIGESPYNTAMYFRNSRDIVDSFSTWARVLDTATDATSITNWNTAYGWGNHASVGYLTSSSSLAWGKLTGIPSILTKISTNKNDIVGGKNYFGYNKGISTLIISGTGVVTLDPSINGYSIASTTTCSGRISNLGFEGVNGAFVITAWIYASAATTALVNLCDVNSDEYGSGTISITTTATKFVFTFSTNKSYTGSPYYGFLDIEAIPSGVTVYISNLKIERGVVPTDYWYSLEDHYISENSTTNTNFPVLWDNNNRALFHTAAKMTFNPSTGTFNVSGSITEGGTLLTEKYYRFGRYTTGSIDFNSINSSTPGGYQCFVPGGGSYTLSNAPNMSIGGGGGFLIQGHGTHTYWDTQLFLSSQSDTLQFRTSADVSGTKTWRAWHTVWHNGLLNANATWTPTAWQPSNTTMADGSNKTLASWGYSSNDGYVTSANGSFSFYGNSGACNVYADGEFFAKDGQYKLYHSGDFTLNNVAHAIPFFVYSATTYYPIVSQVSDPGTGDCFYFKITGGGWSVGSSSIVEGYIKVKDFSGNKMPSSGNYGDWHCESKGNNTQNMKICAYWDGASTISFYLVLSSFVAGTLQAWMVSRDTQQTFRSLGAGTTTAPSGTLVFDSYNQRSVIMEPNGGITAGIYCGDNSSFHPYFRNYFIENHSNSLQTRILADTSKIPNAPNNWYNSITGREIVYNVYSKKNNSSFFVSDNMTLGGVLNIEGSTPGSGTSADNSKYMPKIQIFGNDIMWTDKSDNNSCSVGGSSTALYIGDPGVKNNTWENNYTSLGQTSGPRLTLLGTYGVNIFSNSAPIHIAPINTNAPLNLNTLYSGGITIIGSSSGSGSTTIIYGSQTTISTTNVNINSTSATTISGSAYVNISAINPVNISEIKQVITTNFVLPINAMSTTNVGFSRAVNTGVNLSGTNHFYLPSGPADGQMIEFFLCNVSSGSIYIRSNDITYGLYLYNGSWATCTLTTTTTPIIIGTGYGGYLRCVYSSKMNRWFIVRL